MVVACGPSPNTTAAGVAGAGAGQLAPLAAQSPTTTTAPSSGAAAEKQAYLSNYVRPDTILHSFHAAEGIWVDCVDVNQQPAMLAPAMAGRSIASPPPLPPANGAGQSSGSRSGAQAAQQDVALHANEFDELGNVRSCAPGTIPIRRTTAADLARFTSLRDFFSKGPGGAPNLTAPQTAAPPDLSGYVYAAQGQSVTNWGMQLFLNIWDPALGTYGSHSISQMWVANTTGGTTETAEAGWNVDSGLYGDSDVHLFIYWTEDGYVNTGCYNLSCTGFVQTDNSVVLGGSFSPVSTTEGTQYDFELTWAKSSSTSDWWLIYQGSTWVGYYPASQYSHGMQTQASLTNYGGEVNISAPNGSVLTQMGSGAFASSGATYAAYQAHLQYVDTDYNTIDVSPDTQYINNSGCYSLSDGYQVGSGFYFGEQTTPEPGYFQFLGGSGCD